MKNSAAFGTQVGGSSQHDNLCWLWAILSVTRNSWSIPFSKAISRKRILFHSTLCKREDDVNGRFAIHLRAESKPKLTSIKRTFEGGFMLTTSCRTGEELAFNLMRYKCWSDSRKLWPRERNDEAAVPSLMPSFHRKDSVTSRSANERTVINNRLWVWYRDLV